MKKNSSMVLKAKLFISNNGQQVCLFFALIILSVILTGASPYFLTISNFSNIILAICVPGVIVSGLTVAMLIGSFDLSQYALMGFAGVVLGLLLQNGWNPVAAISVVFLISLAVGAVNAFLVTAIGIAPMIATIGTQLMLTAASGLFTNGKTVIVNDELLLELGFGRTFGIPNEIYVFVAVVIVVWYVLRYTVFGRKVFACGGSAKAANLAGISVRNMNYGGYMISAAAAGLAAVLNVAQVSSASPTAGSSNAMDGMTGVFLGGVAFGGGKGSVIGSVLGVLFLQVFSNGMVLMGVSAYWQSFIKGIVLILSVSIDLLRTKRANRVVKLKPKDVVR